MQNQAKTKTLELLLKAILVGALTGAAVGLFRYGILQTSAFWLHLFALAHQNAWWLAVIAIGFAAIGVVAGYFIKQQPHVGGSGIPEVKLELVGKLKLQWWPILWRKLIGGILVIGAGLFLGPEGPSLQLGSSIGHGAGEKLKQDKTNLRILMTTGAASGLAAAFGAPLAGTLFVLEEVIHNFSSRVWFNALAGALTADLVSTTIFGQGHSLAITYRHAFPIPLYWHLLLLGVLIGLLGHLYKTGLFSVKRLYLKIAWLPRWLHGLIPLALLVPIAYFWPLITGPGNKLILFLPKLAARSGWTMIGLLVFFYLMRLVFSIVSYDSGLPSGIFLPILTMGALIGAIYGTVMVQLGLMPQCFIANLIVFSMAGLFAAVIRAPFTAIILITEMVGSLLHLFPLAIVAFVALLVDDLLGGRPIYGQLAEAMEPKKDLARTTLREDQLAVPVYESSKLVDQRVAEIAWPQDTLIEVIHRGSEDVIPNGQTKILAGDTLILAIDAGQRAKVYDEMDALQHG